MQTLATGAQGKAKQSGKVKRWREAPDSWVGTKRRVSVANPRGRTVGAKNTPRARRHWAHGSAKCLLKSSWQNKSDGPLTET